MNFRLFLLKLALPITKLMNKLHISPSYRKIKAEQYRKICRVLQPGDILLTWRWGEFSNLFIPGDWSHAALYTSPQKIREATFDGVHDSDLIDFCLSKDKIAVVRPKLSQEAKTLTVELSMCAIGKPYDFLFSEGDKSFYCSELVFWAYASACKNLNEDFQMKRASIMGVQTFLPDDFISKDNPVFEHIALFP